MKFSHALAASAALGLGIAVTAAPAGAATVTDLVTFSMVGSYTRSTATHPLPV